MKIEKAYAISNAKISFVSLVDKAANKKKFLIAKAENGSATFQSFGRIVKSDPEKHYVTGVVYEPMAADSQGNYMTGDEIAKAAHWFMKNQGSVDIQHCFEKAAGVEVVESFVAKSDMEIDGENIKKGTWLMTAEVTDDDVWDAIQKGEITGFSMGGVGVYSEEDVDLDSVEKNAEPVGLLKRLAKAMGFDVVEKGAVKANFLRRAKDENFYSAWYALRNTLEGNFYNPDTESWEWGYNSDESTVREALTDFNEIVTQILTSDGSIVKSLEKAAVEAPQSVMKAGKSLSSKNLQALQGINNSLSEFLSSFTEGEGDSNNTEAQSVKKKEEEVEMKKEDVQKMVADSVEKAMEPVLKALEEITKEDGGSGTGAEAAGGDCTAEDVSEMVAKAVEQGLEPILKAMEPILRSRALPGNLNDFAWNVEKADQHYMAGMF